MEYSREDEEADANSVRTNSKWMRKSF